MFTRIGSRRLLSHTIEEQIETAIREKRIVPGQKLPTEVELCDLFGVSRTVLREALRMLSARGLIDIEKGKGMFVSSLSAEDVVDPMRLYLTMNLKHGYALDVIHARQIIEPSIAELASFRRTDADVAKLKSDVQHLEAARGDYGELAALDMAFHRDIAVATQNPIMPLILDPVHRLMPEIKSTIYATVSDARESAIVWHNKIFDAIATGAPDLARAQMTEHLRIAEDHVKRMLETRSTSHRIE